MAPPTSRLKRSAALDIEGTLSLQPVLKKARFELGNERDESSSPDAAYSAPASPALSDTFSEAVSVATSATSRTTSKRPKKYLCAIAGCGKAFDRPARIEIHMRSHTNERPFVCEEDDCGKTFQRNEHLKRHMLDKHSEARNHVCTFSAGLDEAGLHTICGKSFTTATRLRRHVAAHEAKEETTCMYLGCGKVFRKQETLQKHVKTDHLHEKPFNCTHVEVDGEGQSVMCQQSFSKSEQLKKHEAREHSGVRYFCDICSPEAAEAVMIDGDIGLGSLDPETAPIGFSTYADLQVHIQTAHPPTCADCGKQCETNRALKAHIDIEHSTLSARQTHFCSWPNCGRGFTKAGNLKVHIQSVHNKARNFVCGDFDLTGNDKVEGWNGQGCGTAFGTKANLEEHVRTQHIGLPGKIKPSRQRKREERLKAGSQTPSTAMSVDELHTPADGALSMLTGFGYDTLPGRHIACLMSACQQRFGREYDLAEHLELTHGWNIDDVNDCLVKKQRPQSEDFWPGGTEQLDAQEKALKASLEAALGTSEEAAADERYGNVRAHEDAVMKKQAGELQRLRLDKMRKPSPGRASGLFAAAGAVEEGGMLIDPALVDV